MVPISDKRLARFKEVIANRQFDLTVVLENVHDPHNIGAVLRTCDAVGIREVYVILNDPQIDPKRYQVGTKSSSSAKKWIDIHLFEDLDEAIKKIKLKYKRILGTHLGAESVSLFDLELCEPVALMFGNEHEGLTDAALEKIDGNFIIPQYGMTQSLNISVACAVSLYEACGQRTKAGKYGKPFTSDGKQTQVLEKFTKIHESGYIRNR